MPIINLYLFGFLSKVEDGSVSGIRHKLADQEHIEVVTQAMSRAAFVNPLNPEVFPGVCKMEAEVVFMNSIISKFSASLDLIK